MTGILLAVDGSTLNCPTRGKETVTLDIAPATAAEQVANLQVGQPYTVLGSARPMECCGRWPLCAPNPAWEPGRRILNAEPHAEAGRMWMRARRNDAQLRFWRYCGTAST